MAEKCELCGQKIATTFLGKLVGTAVGSGKSRKYVCSQCQKENKGSDIKELLEK